MPCPDCNEPKPGERRDERFSTAAQPPAFEFKPRSFPRAPPNSLELQAERVSNLDRSGLTTHYCLKAVLVAPSTPGT